MSTFTKYLTECTCVPSSVVFVSIPFCCVWCRRQQSVNKKNRSSYLDVYCHPQNDLFGVDGFSLRWFSIYTHVVMPDAGCVLGAGRCCYTSLLPLLLLSLSLFFSWSFVVVYILCSTVCTRKNYTEDVPCICSTEGVSFYCGVGWLLVLSTLPCSFRSFPALVWIAHTFGHKKMHGQTASKRLIHYIVRVISAV